MDPEELARLVRSMQETWEKISPALIALNAAPNTSQVPGQLPAAIVAPVLAQGITDQSIGTSQSMRRYLTAQDQLEMRRELRKMSVPELHMLFGEQARKSGTGIPLGLWLNANGQQAIDAFEQGRAGGVFSPDVLRALDTAGGSALIRQDLEPILYELYIRTFPAFERFTKEPANGLVHTYQQITSFGDAQFMAELGTVTDDKSTYVRQTTNVAIVATRRGVSLKTQFATLQSGSGFNPEQLELQGGLRAIAQKMQRQIFSGNGTDSGGTASNELGLFDANGFTGLRAILNTVRAKNLDPDTLPDSTGDVGRAIRSAAIEIMQNGGTASMVYLSPLDKETFDNQQAKNVRYMGDTTSVAVGFDVNVVNTVFGKLGLFPVPGDAISSYTAATFAGNTVRDMYVLDESTISLPFLGSEGPTVLDIPIGISGQLTHLYIIFGMWGLAVKAPIWSNKVRVKVA